MLRTLRSKCGIMISGKLQIKLVEKKGALFFIYIIIQPLAADCIYNLRSTAF